MSPHAHIIIAVTAAFAGGEITGMALILALWRRASPQGPGKRRRSIPGDDAQVIPPAREEASRPVGKPGDAVVIPFPPGREAVPGRVRKAARR